MPRRARAMTPPAGDAPAPPAATAVRAAQDGDIGPTTSPEAIEAFAVREGVDAATEAQLAALRDILRARAPADGVRLLRQLLRQQRELAPAPGSAPDEALADDWRNGGYPYRNLLSRKSYERQKYRLQVELLKLQAWVKESGEIVLFDRSWYNRAGVERVMGFCTQPEYLEFMRQAPEFERMLVHQGIHLVKFWFSVSREEQRRRFQEREAHPLKQWKLSPVDLASLDKWDAYTKAKEAMFFYTDTADAPWTVIKSDGKKRARLNAMRYLLHGLPYPTKDLARIGPVDPLLVGRAHVVYERGEQVTTPLL